MSWPEPLVKTPSASSILETRPRYQASDLWLPIDSPTIVSVSGATTSLGEHTVPISTNTETTLVPQDAYRAWYRIDATQTAGSGTVSIALLHKPAGNGSLAVYTSSAGQIVSNTGPTDINQARLTYWTSITGTPTYSFTIYLVGFDRIPS